MLPLLLLPLATAGIAKAAAGWARRDRGTDGPSAAVGDALREHGRADALERRLTAVLQASGDAYVVVGVDGVITEWNEEAERTFGWCAAEVLGLRLEDVVMPPEYQEMHPGAMRAHRPGGTGFMVGRRAHVEALHRDGRVLPVEVRAWASPDGHGWSAFVRDITDRVDAQAQLEAARDAALAASRLKSEFLANMSHEVRTPMNGVIGMSTLLLASDLDAEQRAYAETVRSSAEALLTVIDDILDFSKIEAGKLDVETIDLDLRTVVEESASLLSARAEEKGLELTCLVDPDVPALLRGDPGRLRQVLLNLVGNAVKFTTSGEVAVRARVLAQDQQRAMVEIQVRDTGIGVDPETVDSLFEAFAQADASTTRRYGGSGLGLAISRQLVGLMGGELTATGEPGSGSVFRARLTLDRAWGARAAAGEVDLRGVRVLVVDDSPAAGRVLQRLLQGWGCRTTVSHDAPRALATAGAAARSGEPFDVALVDLHMPDVDGLALARALAADPRLHALRTVLVGSALHPGDPERARAAGAVGVLAKPVRSAPLQQVLAGALGRDPVLPVPAPGDALPADERSEHVLLVEDNPVNQQVGLLTLQRLGCTVDVVGDGAQALDALTASTYDLVLMDCQMPVLDGFDATRELRRRERETDGPRTPVVALTASAMAADRDECLAAGMDDHLSKPLRAADLVAVLDRWAPSGRPASAPTVAGVPEPRAADDLPVLDAAVTGPLQALGPDVLGQIGATYLADVPVRLQALRTAVRAGDADTVRRAAHAVKGASAGIGAVRVRAAAGALEQAARDGELPADSSVDRLEALVAEVRQALDRG